MNKSTFKTLILALLSITILSTQSLVFAEENHESSSWILVGDSPLLDRSSKYLFNGNTKSGLKYAKKALARSQSKYAQLIAQHNLCIAYALQGQMDQAEGHCAEAANNSMLDVALKEIKPGLFKISHRKAIMPQMTTLNAVIAQNLESQGLNTAFPRLAQAN